MKITIIGRVNNRLILTDVEAVPFTLSAYPYVKNLVVSPYLKGLDKSLEPTEEWVVTETTSGFRLPIGPFASVDEAESSVKRFFDEMPLTEEKWNNALKRAKQIVEEL